MDGSGSTLVDSSGTPKTVAAGGNTTQSSAESKFGGKSCYFDGTGDYVTSDTSAAQFGTSDFCVEFWLYITAAATNHQYGSCLFDTRGTQQSFNGIALFLNSSGVLTTYDANTFANASASSAVPFSQWVHVAAVRRSGTQQIYVNGAVVLSYASSYNHTGTQLTIGGTVDYRDGSGDFKLTGYIDEFRVTKDSAREYTGGFTPPASAFPDGEANVSLLLHMDGSNGSTTFTDSSSNGVSMTASASNATITTAQSKFGGASASFAGTNGRVSGSNSSLFQFGTGDFTVEMWVRVASSGAYQTFFTTRSSSTAEDGNAIWVGLNTGTLTPIVYSDLLLATSSVSLTAGTWSHLAVSRTSGRLRIFVDGVQAASVSDSTNFTVGHPTLGYTLANEHPLTGHIDELRITKGVSRFTGAISPPTSAFPDE
jgi:hypothetical protein